MRKPKDSVSSAIGRKKRENELAKTKDERRRKGNRKGKSHFRKLRDEMTREGMKEEDAQVNSPVQSRACQQVSMYHRLLIASQYLATWLPPLYRPHLPPLHLPRPEGTSMTNIAVASR